jgi:GxxExxY protein
VADAPRRDRHAQRRQQKLGAAKDAKEDAKGAKVTEEDIGRAIIGAAMKIHTVLGPGLLESTYETCLIYELEKQRIPVRSQVSVPIRYEDLRIENGYRLDLLADGRVVVELKAVPAILPVHRSQLLSYLRLGTYKLGYLLNFQVAHMRDGIVRLVNGL